MDYWHAAEEDDRWVVEDLEEDCVYLITCHNRGDYCTIEPNGGYGSGTLCWNCPLAKRELVSMGRWRIVRKLQDFYAIISRIRNMDKDNLCGKGPS